MKNQRPWKDVEIDEKVFSQQWWVWWASLQPTAWIYNENNASFPTPEMDWSHLKKPGKNGFFLIMLALVWWGKASNRDEGWVKAVVDVTIVLHCMQGTSNDTPAASKLPKRGPLINSSATNSALSVLSKQQFSI